MNRRSLLLVGVLYLLPASFYGKDKSTLPNEIEQVRQSVVQIVINLADPRDRNRLPVGPIYDHLRDGPLIMGTGVMINHNGDFLTAAHVVLEMNKLDEDLTKLGIKTLVMVGFTSHAFDAPNVRVYSTTSYFESTEQRWKVAGDVAIVHVDRAPERGSANVAGVTTLYRPKPSKFSLKRPRAGDPVFACGYPMFSQDLVTTSGTVASSDGFENLITAKEHGVSTSVDVLKLDVRISPGNSGGPVFRRSDGSVVGMIVEVMNGGGYSIAVPASVITDALTEAKIPWERTNEK